MNAARQTAVVRSSRESGPSLEQKDSALWKLHKTANVAQFVSFDNHLNQRYCVIRGVEEGHRFLSIEDAISALISQTDSRSVNIRAFPAQHSLRREFIYGIRSTEETCEHLYRLSAAGCSAIVNETIDICDGGVSGVLLGGVMEFAPADTPRAVEKAGVASLSVAIGCSVLETVYGVKPALDYSLGQRVEFSLHPTRQGYLRQHTTIWELEAYEPLNLAPRVVWPNRFSRFLGDKVFGLLIADAIGLRVPRSTIVSRAVAPFSFGIPTGTGDSWTRTSPSTPLPGKLPSYRGWRDPFEFMHEHDPKGSVLPSLIFQEGVEAHFSGAALSLATGGLLIEGVRGRGDRFMLGSQPPEILPGEVTASVHRAHQTASQLLRNPRLEWVHDGENLWIVQLHADKTAGFSRTPQVIYPGKAAQYINFEVSRGLEELRHLVAGLNANVGVILVGHVGITSHFGDVLRTARVPSSVLGE